MSRRKGLAKLHRANNLSVVIPTYRREQVLIDTIDSVRLLTPKPSEILVIDQSPTHEPPVAARLAELAASGEIRHIFQDQPSITRAMNTGLRAAQGDIVLFIDDDIVPFPGLVQAHLEAHNAEGIAIVAGRVLQPWHKGFTDFHNEPFHFASLVPRRIDLFMAGNVSIRRDRAIALGGFDENFERVAYNFEAEFAHRALAAGEQIHFQPTACIDHLKASTGGTRTFGEHFTTVRPDHAVGAYYYILRTWGGAGSLGKLIHRAAKAVLTRHHFRRPWWIPITLLAEIRGFCWAVRLAQRGPRYIQPEIARGDDRLC